jgi:6-phosphogluconolactonase
MPPEIHILDDTNALAKRAAQEFLQAATSAVSARGVFTVALTGGSTPKPLYSLLATDSVFRAQLPWDKMRIYFGDERTVPPDHADSNFRMANEAMLSKAPLKPDQVFRIKGEYKDTERAAQEYEQSLRSSFRIEAGQLPRFDLVLLGMGNEGHVASLFPGTKATHETSRLVVRNWVGKLYTERITLTFPVLNHAAYVLFMVAGQDKALALKGVLEGPQEPEQLPAQGIAPINGKALWLLDSAAGKLLTNGIRD